MRKILHSIQEARTVLDHMEKKDPERCVQDGLQAEV